MKHRARVRRALHANRAMYNIEGIIIACAHVRLYLKPLCNTRRHVSDDTYESYAERRVALKTTKSHGSEMLFNVRYSGYLIFSLSLSSPQIGGDISS